MACSVLKQICINDQIGVVTQRSPDKIPDLVKVSQKQLKKASDSINDFLKNSEKSEIFQLKLGELRINIQLKDEEFLNKFLISKTVSETFGHFSDESILNSSSAYPSELSDLEGLPDKFDDFSLVFQYILSTDSVSTVKSIQRLSRSLESVIESLDLNMKKLQTDLKELTSPPEKNFIKEINKLKEEIEELTFQLNLTEKPSEHEMLEMEITRKTNKISELRSSNIMAITESRCKLYQNSLNTLTSQKHFNHIRNKSSLQLSKAPETIKIKSIPKILQDLQDFSDVLEILKEDLRTFNSRQ
jgi:hypothetical protein